MAKFSADYTAGDILELYRQRSADGEEARLRNIATQMRQLCRLEHEVVVPAQYRAITRQVRTPFIRDSWHRISSSLVAKPPLPHITPKDEKRQEYREAANTAERFDVAMIERFNKERGTDIIYSTTAQLVRDGESCIKVQHRPDAWANFPMGVDTDEQDMYKRGADLPIAWRDVDRMCMVYEDGEYGDLWDLEYGEYTKPYLRSRYGVRDEEFDEPADVLEGRGYPEGLHPTNNQRSVKVEFWTPKEWHVLINGHEAKGFPKRNPYSPHLPYFRAGAYDNESLLYSLLFLVPRLDELLTMKLNWSVLGAYPTPVMESVPNAQTFPSVDGPFGNPGELVTANGKPLTWAPGKLMEVPLGRKFSFLAPPPVGKDLNDLVQIFKSLIDIAGIPSIMRGISDAGTSGYLGNQMRAAAQMAYRLAAISLQRQLEKATEFSHWLVPNVVKQTVYAQGWDAVNPKTGRPKVNANRAWLGLSPDHQSVNVADVSKLGPVSYQYRPMQPTDEQAAAMIALQVTNAEKPLSSIRHALEEYMQQEDPESIMDEIEVEKALSEEPLATIVREEALREAGINQPPPPVNPAAALVGPDGMPLLGGVMSPGMQGGAIPMANAAPPGVPGVPGVTMPLTPPIPVGNGGRPPGVYPGMPGGPNQQ